MRPWPCLILLACGDPVGAPAFDVDDALAALDPTLVFELPPPPEGPGTVTVTLDLDHASDHDRRFAPFGCEACEGPKQRGYEVTARGEVVGDEGPLGHGGHVTLSLVEVAPRPAGFTVGTDHRCGEPDPPRFQASLCEALEAAPGANDFSGFDAVVWGEHGRATLRLELSFGDEGDGGPPVDDTLWSHEW